MALTHNYKHRERIQFKINTPLIHEILLAGYIQFIDVLMGGSLVISAGTTSGTSLGENPGNFVNRLVVEGASKGQYPNGKLRSLLSRSLIRRRVFDYGWTYLDTALTGAAGTFTLNQPYRLNFQYPRCRRPIETSLKTDAYTGLQLRIETNSGPGQFSGSDRTFDFSGVTLDVFDHRENMTGLMTATLEDDLPIIINAANKFFTFTDLPAGADFLDLLVITETTNQQLSAAVLNRLAVDFGQESNYDWFEPELREVQREFFYTNTVDVGGQVGDYTADPSQQKGCYYIPLVKDGDLAGAIPVRSNKQAKIIADVANPGGAGNDRLIVSSRRILTPVEMGLVKA